MLSSTEENYLKTIYHLGEQGGGDVSTNAISDTLNTKPASVSDMLKKLAQKKVINYRKYKGVSLSEAGKKQALKIVRKHRLWEVFLVDKLSFNWDEVHDVAEQLEHIKSPLLIQRLDEFLGKPDFDPHGDPIPNEDGEIVLKQKILLGELAKGKKGVVVGVDDSSAVFLQYLDKLGVEIGAKLTINERLEFDGSLEITINGQKNTTVSKEVAANIYVSEA